MSASQVGVDHIEAMLAAADSYGRGRHAGEGTFSYRYADEVIYIVTRMHETGRMLWLANARSVEARYPPGRPGLQSAREMGLIPELAEGFRFNPYRQRTPTPVQALKLCDCFRYQACEPEDWRRSEAAAFVEALEHRAIEALPGYAEASWEWRG